MKTKVAVAMLSVLALTACEKFQNKAEVQSQRFQIYFNPSVRADTFLVDTEKGRVWQMTKITDATGEPVVWSPMFVIDDTGTVGKSWSDFYREYAPKVPGKKN